MKSLVEIELKHLRFVQPGFSFQREEKGRTIEVNAITENFIEGECGHLNVRLPLSEKKVFVNRHEFMGSVIASIVSMIPFIDTIEKYDHTSFITGHIFALGPTPHQSIRIGADPCPWLPAYKIKKFSEGWTMCE